MCWNCHYNILQKQYVPPQERLVSIEGGHSNDIHKLLIGYTIVTLQCKKCGNLKQEELLGEINEHNSD